MSLALVLPLAAGAVAMAGLGLAAPRPFVGAAALAAMGALVGVLLLGGGHPGLAVATLASVWGVAAAGLVIARRLSEVEAQEEAEPSRGPWILAFVSSALLTLAIALGVLVVDWPAARGPGAGAAAAGPGALAPDAGLCEWALAALGVAVALALAAYAPRAEEE